MEKINRGSEWRKWDLHFHTPSSYDYDDKSVSNQSIIDKLIENHISLVAITDHHIIDIDRIRGLQKIAGDKVTILPGIEFCSELGGSDSIHFIGIFPENCDLESIWTKIQGKHNLTDSDKKTKGEQSIQCKFEETCSTIIDLGGIVSVHAGSKTNSIESIKNNLLNKMEQKNNLLSNYISILEIGKKEDENDYKSKVFPSIGYSRPIVICSDNHNIKNYEVKQNLWIKADATFEGLKQIIFEPDERVKIQNNKPEEKAGYHVIDSVELKEDNFWNEKIYLNENLNTIVGGRSTGKSTLIESIAKKINNTGEFYSNEFINNHLEGVNVYWKDGELNSARDIEFFPQNHMHNIAKNQEKTSQLIKRIVKGKDKDQIISNYESYCDQNRIEISANINQLFQLQTNIKAKKNELKECGDKNGIENEISIIEGKLNNIKSNNEITEGELIDYHKIIAQISDKEVTIKQIDDDIVQIHNIKEKSLFNQYNEYGFNALSENNKRCILNSYQKLRDEFTEKWEKILDEKCNQLLIEKQKIESELNNIRKHDVYIKGNKYVIEDKEFGELQLKIDEERKKLSGINELEKKVELEEKQKKELITIILESHKNYYERAKELSMKVNYQFEGIEITSNLNFRENSLRLFLESKHNLRSNENKTYFSYIVDNYKGKTDEVIRGYINYTLDGYIEYKGGNIDLNVATELVSTNWFDISYDLNYQNDNFKSMSQGKQAFVVLKLLLEYSDKKCPILIDQPEDSLDNRAIYNELVQYIKKKKKERQIIIVTHNPNVVVGADSEQVIVANQDGDDCKNNGNVNFQYLAGALENTKKKDNNIDIILESQGIREHVCEILEGGKEAFVKREVKYGF